MRKDGGSEDGQEVGTAVGGVKVHGRDPGWQRFALLGGSGGGGGVTGPVCSAEGGWIAFATGLPAIFAPPID